MWGGTAGFVRSGRAFVDDVTELLNQPVIVVQRIVRRQEERDNMQEVDKVHTI